MYFGISGDTDSESGVGEVIYSLSGLIKRRFQPNDYGNVLLGIFIVLMCQDHSLNLKRRIRFVKKDKTLYMDIMLELEEMKGLDFDERKNIICNKIIEEVQSVLNKYSFRDFDQTRFMSDLQDYLLIAK